MTLGAALLVVGHIPRAVGSEGVLQAHQAIVHAEEYVYTVFDWNVEDEARIPGVVAATHEAGVPVTLTLVCYDHIFQQAADLPTFLARPELKYLAPWARVLWGPGLNRYNPANSSAKSLEFGRKSLAFQKTLARSLHRAGVKVLAGTDSMVPGSVPGFGLIEELQNLAELGLTPFEVIRAATSYPAEFLGGSNEFGTIAAGRRADLILVNGNPLADLANVQRRVGVMAHGDWRTEAQLQKMLDEIPVAYAGAERHMESLLSRDPSAASRYMDESDPFEYVALAAEANLIARSGMASFENIYRNMQSIRPDGEILAELNMQALGHRMFGLGKTNEAIDLLKMNMAAHPKSAKACDSLAEAHFKNGDRKQAAEFYRRALAIDPAFTSSLEALNKLSL